MQEMARRGGMNATAPPNPNQAAHDARWRRLIDLVEQRTPDRMPIILYATFWLAKYGNVSHKELMYDYDRTKAIAERAILELDPDAYAPLFLLTASGRSLEALGYKQLQWPGHGVGDHQPFQYLDREYMQALFERGYALAQSPEPWTRGSPR